MNGDPLRAIVIVVVLAFLGGCAASSPAHPERSDHVADLCTSTTVNPRLLERRRVPSRCAVERPI